MRKLGLGAAVASAVIAVLGLVYRSTLYWKIPVADGEPYGFGDILDFGFAVTLVFVAGITLLASFLMFFLWERANLQTGIKVAFIAGASFAAYYVFHPLMPRLL